MKVKELIKELQKYKDDTDVKILYSYKPECDCKRYCCCSYVDNKASIQAIDPAGKEVVITVI